MKTWPLFFLLAPSATAWADDDATVTPLVQLQLWGTIFDMDEADQADGAGYGDPEHDPGFSLRRARVGLEGQKGNLDFQVDFGLSAPYDSVAANGRPSPTFAIANAFGRGSWRTGSGTTRASFGVVRVPFTRERIMSSRELTFQERAVGTAWLGPAQDLGVLLDHERDGGLRFQLGVYNGGGNLLGDDNFGVMVAGRAEYATGGDTYVTHGESTGVDGGIAIAGYWNDNVANDEFAGEVDALLRIKRFTVMSEAIIRLLQPGDTTIALPDALSPATQLGATLQLSYWTPVGEPDGPADSRSAVEWSVRGGLFDENVALSNYGDVLIVHGGAMWRNVSPGLDAGFAWVHREEIGGNGVRAIPNDTFRLMTQLRWPQRGVSTSARAPSTVPSEADSYPPPRTTQPPAGS